MLIFTSCYWDRKSQVLAVRNMTIDTVFVVKTLSAKMTDSILFNADYDVDYFMPRTDNLIYVPKIAHEKGEKSNHLYVYFFKAMAVREGIKSQKMKGLFNHSFIKFVQINLEKIKNPVDTIVLK